MKKFGVLFVGVLLLVACGGAKEVAKNTENVESEIANTNHTEHQIIFEDIEEGDSLFASIQKTYCFGKCPVYTMKIYNGGYVTFVGKANVNMMGNHMTVIRGEDMIRFIDMANEINYFDLEDNYDNPAVSDLPSTTTSIVMNGKRKTVRRRVNFPSELKRFEELFEDLIKNKEWIADRS